MPIIKTGTTTTLTADTNYSDVLQIEGTLVFDPSKNITLTMNNQNIVVNGKFTRRPNPGITHRIVIAGINESKFVGGGDAVIDSDKGIWTMGSGQLDWVGQDKMGWLRPASPIKNGEVSFTCAVDPTGWQAGDEIVAMPTAPGAQNYDERKIKSISGRFITVDKPFTDHPQIAGFPTGEIINLTRNVTVEGTPNGRTHVFIHSTAKQNLTAVDFRYMGPRKTQQGFPNSLVGGRYGIHFHHSEDGSRGTIVDCCVVRDSGSHCFVPHGSYGITFEQCVGYNSLEDQYWYDLNHSTHDLTFDECLAARIGYVPGSLDMDLWAIDTTDKVPSLGANGFLLGRGDNNTIKGCVVVGSSGDPHAKAGYLWPTRSETQPEGVWLNIDNLGHNCSCSSLTWQNTALNHTVTNYLAYSNGLDMYHGAYANNYIYRLLKMNGLTEIKAASFDRLRFEKCEFGEVNLLGGAESSQLPMLFLDCVWKKWVDAVGEEVHGADLVGCEGSISLIGLPTEVVRVQPKTGQAYKLTKPGQTAIKTNIPNFAPTMWGTGTGLRGEYFNSPNFTNKVFERIDPVIALADWNNWVHYLVTSKKFSVIWTGEVQAQFTEAHSFTMGGGGEMELWISGQKVTGKINLVAGKRYPIEVRFSNNDDNVSGGANLLWESKSISIFSPPREYIPQLQLYPSGSVTPPANKPPVANAGNDITITLPQNSVTLNGSGSDSDGTIVSYRWDYIAGPIPKVEIANPFSQSTSVAGFAEGNYLFRLQVIDNQGAAASDEISITVKPKPTTNNPPNVSISISKTVLTDVVLKSTVTDSDSTVVSYQWSQVSGPTVILSGASTSTLSFKGAPKGDYSFNLIITYNNQGQTITPYNFSL